MIRHSEGPIFLLLERIWHIKMYLLVTVWETNIMNVNLSNIVDIQNNLNTNDLNLQSVIVLLIFHRFYVNNESVKC